METIFGLLLILLPVIFKLIGKKFEQSGKAEKAEKLKKIADVFGDDGEENPFKEWLNAKPETEAEDVPERHPEPVPATQPQYTEKVEKQVAVRKPVLLEEDKTEKKEKIDPKKLVIYSEIMKPKYTE